MTESTKECVQSECTICLLNYNEETKKITECHHIFHQECLDKWLQNNTSCPLCRTELYNSSRFRLEFTPLHELFIDRTIQPSGSIGITRVGSPFELNVTYADEVWITQLEEELTQVATDSLSSGGSSVADLIHAAPIQTFGEFQLFANELFSLYPTSMTRAELSHEEEYTGEEDYFISNGIRLPVYRRNQIY
uniref:RING-type domain-containing protein n=1 Tax=viral metagenome TaxID=1070528 RepID=A0A6C0HHM3_9ZZZZ